MARGRAQRTSRGRQTRARSRRRTAPRAGSPRRASRARSTLRRPNSMAACVRNATFLWLESTSVNCQSGRTMANGIPGMPPPEPTSSTRNASLPRQLRQHRERIEQMMRDHPPGFANRGQVVGLVPLREQPEIRRAIARAAPRSRPGPARRCRRASVSANGIWTPTLATSAAASPPRGRSSRLGAARRRSCDGQGRGHQSGHRRAVTPISGTRRRERRASDARAGAKSPPASCPEMRAAWPIVSGLPAASFCCASVDSPRTSR